MIESTEEKLSEFQERDLSSYDFVSMWIDGKTFADDMLVVAMGLTMDGYKIPMGFVQTGTENKMVISKFLRDLINRGLDLSQGLLVVIDGAKGLYTAVKEVFQNRVIIQRCQFHKRENIVSYLPKEEQEKMFTGSIRTSFI
jgi:putative transposase